MTVNNEQHQNQGSGGGFLAGVILGGIVGAAVALLTSPKSGREVRTYLDEKTSTSRERLTVKSKEIRDKAEPVVGEWIKVASDKAAPVLNIVKDKAREAAELKQQIDEDDLSIEEAMEKADQLVAEAESEVKEQLNRATEENESNEQAKQESKEESKEEAKEASNDDVSSAKQETAEKKQPSKAKSEKPVKQAQPTNDQEEGLETPVSELLDADEKKELNELKQELKNGK